MGIVSGPFPQVTFCGASIIEFSSFVGWNEQSSNVTVRLVEDPLLGQSFSRPGMGVPVKFAYEGFKFEGLVQRWVQTNAIDGKPTYEIQITDPREILAGAQVILSSYRGNIGGFANLLNVFGYWEDAIGFGGSLSNESGMVWNSPFEALGISSGGGITINDVGSVGIMPAIHQLTNNSGPFGGPLRFHGYEYSVDLSSLPIPPAYYRMGGVSSSILDMVSEICQDGGHDFICNLQDGVISFRTVSRVMQPDPGQIANFINSRTDVASNNIGYELRNDITNAILLGGDQSELVQEYNLDMDDTIWPYWGLDATGAVIMGQGKPEVQHKFDLNASPIADIMGQLTYPCDIPQMRCALIDYDSWAFYVMKFYPDVAQTVNLVSAIDDQSQLASLFPSSILQRDLINDSQDAVTLFGPMNDNDYWTQRAQRVYEFVRQYASDYFGKKFLVKIPFFIYYKAEPETTNIIKSSEPSDGGYQAEGSLPLGLQFINESMFLGQDGRFQCFVKYTNAVQADIQKLSPDSCLIQGTDIYVKASVSTDVGVVYPPGSILPYCVVEVDSVVYQQADSPLGSMADIANMLDYDQETLQYYAAGMRYDSFPIKIHPGPYRPNAVALPMKSNRDSYGPWFTSGGVDGKVSFERDDSLVPWNYGDYYTMNLAAKAKLANAATAMQYTETGSVQIAGTPDHSLGDELVAGGPQLTGIDVQINSGGVTTTYRMQTFTPRFGTFSKDNADRLRRLGTAAMDMRRQLRNLFQKQQAFNNVVASAKLGFMANTSRAVRQQTPHQCLMGLMSYDTRYNYRTQVASMTACEAIANCRGDSDDLWPATALMTMEGLLRPFSTNSKRSSNDPLNDMPHYEKITNDDLTVNGSTLDPFGANNDIDYIAWGDTYPGNVHTLKAGGGDASNSRLLGLRGPLAVVGWGYSYTGKPVPNPKDDGNTPENKWSDKFIDKHRSHPEKWKAGPVGLYWDNWRKMWTIPTILYGTLDDTMSSLGVTMTIQFNGDTVPDKITVFNKLGNNAALKKGITVYAAYHQQLNEWHVISAACGTA